MTYDMFVCTLNNNILPAEPALILSTREIIGLSVGVAAGAIALIILTIVFVVCLRPIVKKMDK